VLTSASLQGIAKTAKASAVMWKRVRLKNPVRLSAVMNPVLFVEKMGKGELE
jgi:hypothetical protein